MKAYKFLRPGRVAHFSEFEWPEDEWVEADGPLETCRSGIHACRPHHLAYWLADELELWEVWLDGEVVETALKVVARRGRLVARVDAWNESVREEFRVECVHRTARYAVAELREMGVSAAAAELERALTLDELSVTAREAAAAAGEAGAEAAVALAAYVEDAAGYAEMGHTAGTAFVAAHAADVHAPPDVDDPFVAEREEQSAWLAARLGLSADGV